MGKREMDDEQRERMRDLNRIGRQTLPYSGGFVVFAVLAGVFVYDDWTALLWWVLADLAVTGVMFFAQWRYIRRGPFPRLPASMREDEHPRR
ncbi:hypothetical protein SAMN05216188_101610 [Lentzea xinjiangensis]|uniref:2TM domain-containing protein n=1 Tax=Lentzea xinjiangensis TaxID=402600 RepID=A0A1H9B1F1_9PSEU|nr:hypothetical protein [Lentzea xinjiangensis]SEP82655.1 hypothetical protein SAMN05216188_101610 [Lentzea xinjiangensis]